MRPSSFMRFGIRVGPRPKRRPSSFREAVWYRGQRIKAPFFWVTRGLWTCIVARPTFPGEVTPGTRILTRYWESMTGMHKGEILMGLKRPVAAEKTKAGPARPVDEDSELEYTTLYAYLTDDSWEDGQPRQRSTLILFAEDDSFKVCLTDKDSDMTLWASSKTLSGLFGALEARLNDPEAEWRKRKPFQGKGGKKA